MIFKLNDRAINFELDNATIDFTLNDGVLNFKLNAVVVRQSGFRLLEGFSSSPVLYDDLTDVLYDDLSGVTYDDLIASGTISYRLLETGFKRLLE